ncbi:MAG: PEP-CTERM sorting domain-containing protein [Akkermansiaceae bacterium]
MVFLGGVMGAQGVVLLDYQAGIGTGTSTGASDPATQGWAYSGSGSGFSDGFDAGTGVGTTYGGGWRTVDGTSGAQSVYTQDTSPIIGAITAADIWRMSWTVALDQDAVRTVGAAVTDYYNAPNQGRQNAILLYFDMDDVDSFRVVHRVNEFDEVLLDVSGTQYNTGVSLDNFGSYSITYNKAAGTALLDYGAGTATINPSSVDPNRSTIFMGSGSSGGQGSGVWNSMVIETNPVPEPSSVLLSLLGGLALLRRRR